MLIFPMKKLIGNDSLKGRSSLVQDLWVAAVINTLYWPSRPTECIKQVSWIPPDEYTVKANTDGSSLGNPGNGSSGLVCRNSDNMVVGVLAMGLGVVTNYEAECFAIVLAVETAVRQRWLKIWIKLDSSVAVLAFNGNQGPWQWRQRWRRAYKQL
ncbi:hypothetical protein IFM89_037917 [Coptis chinensis]|uniref:RNase H type-1 domain-containing protein n=1 Tax=Coptis chinensis TaxID=261450 RepID=A0A835IL71_9MAGN|nr:hypothetical protein IFM89_037917 [Coptis chinensis]